MIKQPIVRTSNDVDKIWPRDGKAVEHNAILKEDEALGRVLLQGGVGAHVSMVGAQSADRIARESTACDLARVSRAQI